MISYIGYLLWSSLKGFRLKLRSTKRGWSTQTTPLRIMHVGLFAALVPAKQMMIKCHEDLSSFRPRILSSAGIFCKTQTDTIHTVTLIRGSLIPLTLEYMAEVTPTVRAYDLCPLHAKCGINVSSYSTRDGIKVCWPSTARFELVIGSIKWRIATSTIVDAFGRVVGIVFTGASALSTLLTENAELFCSHYCKLRSIIYALRGEKSPWYTNLGSEQLSTHLRFSGWGATWFRLFVQGCGWS